MRAALSLLILLGACGGGEAEQTEANTAAAAPTDIDVLPADESVATESGELATGVDEPEVDGVGADQAEANQAVNGY